MWDRRAQYVENHDGDSAKMHLDKGEGYIFENYPVRLMGVFCPEMDQEGGPECQQFVENWFKSRLHHPRWNFIVTTIRMKVADKEQSTLSRYVCKVDTIDSSENLNAEIIQFVADRGYPRGIGG